jgi:hypothetical protein
MRFSSRSYAGHVRTITVDALLVYSLCFGGLTSHLEVCAEESQGIAFVPRDDERALQDLEAIRYALSQVKDSKGPIDPLADYAKRPESKPRLDPARSRRLEWKDDEEAQQRPKLKSEEGESYRSPKLEWQSTQDVTELQDPQQKDAKTLSSLVKPNQSDGVRFDLFRPTSLVTANSTNSSVSLASAARPGPSDAVRSVYFQEIPYGSQPLVTPTPFAAPVAPPPTYPPVPAVGPNPGLVMPPTNPSTFATPSPTPYGNIAPSGMVPTYPPTTISNPILPNTVTGPVITSPPTVPTNIAPSVITPAPITGAPIISTPLGTTTPSVTSTPPLIAPPPGYAYQSAPIAPPPTAGNISPPNPVPSRPNDVLPRYNTSSPYVNSQPFVSGPPCERDARFMVDSRVFKPASDPCGPTGKPAYAPQSNPNVPGGTPFSYAPSAYVPYGYGGYNPGYAPLIGFGQNLSQAQLGRGILGQPTAYVANQPFRNFLRYLFP